MANIVSKHKYDLLSSIAHNRQELTAMLSGANTFKRLNNLNWLRHEMAYTEPRILFQSPNPKEQSEYLDYTYMKNTEAAYDKIATFFCSKPHIHNSITIQDVYDIHRILTNNTHMEISGGILRDTGKILNIKYSDGTRVYAPDAHEIEFRLNEIIYALNNSNTDKIINAFNVHYDMIMLQPFEDFNKRTARAVMNMYLVQNGYRPIVFNAKSDRRDYFDALEARANGNTGAYMHYMMQCMVRTQEQLMRVIKKSKIM